MRPSELLDEPGRILDEPARNQATKRICSTKAAFVGKTVGTVSHLVRTFLRRLGVPMACITMFSLLGGHMAVFQVVAWAQMLRDYSRDAGMAEAVDKTFSGKAPCAMCKSIAKEKQKEEKAPATVKVEKKAEIFLLSSHDLAPRPGIRDFCYLPDRILVGPIRFDSPPRPVPRLLISASI